MLANAPQIAAVIRPRLRSIVPAGGVCWLVVCGIAIRKAVGPDQVVDVVRRKALKFVDGLRACRQRQLERGQSGRSCNPANGGAGFCVRTELQPDTASRTLLGDSGAEPHTGSDQRAGSAAKTNRPNAPGTWKFGWGVCVGRQAE